MVSRVVRRCNIRCNINSVLFQRVGQSIIVPSGVDASTCKLFNLALAFGERWKYFDIVLNLSTISLISHKELKLSQFSLETCQHLRNCVLL